MKVLLLDTVLLSWEKHIYDNDNSCRSDNISIFGNMPWSGGQTDHRTLRCSEVPSMSAMGSMCSQWLSEKKSMCSPCYFLFIFWHIPLATLGTCFLGSPSTGDLFMLEGVLLRFANPGKAPCACAVPAPWPGGWGEIWVSLFPSIPPLVVICPCDLHQGSGCQLESRSVASEEKAKSSSGLPTRSQELSRHWKCCFIKYISFKIMKGLRWLGG